MVVTLVAKEGIMEVMSATRMDGLQRAQRRGVTSRIRILAPTDQIWEDCPTRREAVADDSSRKGREQVRVQV